MPSVRREFPEAFVPGRRAPPREVIGDAAERLLNKLANLADRLALRVEGLGCRAHGHHA
jgi:hypothetical protein